ncbi:hypothetical protein PoB_001923300 [Plakobranchus ocellatus]|uniref:Uncharacterized protein n=1 Tax=Plakobranchus ocellatus TaxID=259542 RepID=A0AAV3ZDR6_9GAST|nr:hypothetical protein PoB_001923300 [Plakobranchus ocellatus]
MAGCEYRGSSPRQNDPCRFQGGFAIHCATDAPPPHPPSPSPPPLWNQAKNRLEVSLVNAIVAVHGYSSAVYTDRLAIFEH